MKIFKFLNFLFLLLLMIACSEAEQENVYVDPDHEIPDYQNLEWINSDPISIGESLGNGEIVLIDFWTKFFHYIAKSSKKWIVGDNCMSF